MMDDYSIVWWKDWLNADMLERHTLVGKLPFIKEVISLSKSDDLSDELKEHSISIMLSAFFEDLENEMMIQNG
ncbi:MAG: hypothetical protein DRJ15_08735 [Bacteroidetes bacterium]|nr:MAG: hypothetical protein DRJ15_08735 [Bacteroidota bacterium]